MGHLARRACGHVDVGTRPHQVLASTLTLSQPGGADYAHPILMSTPRFESHRRAWDYILFFSSLQFIILSHSHNVVMFKNTLYSLDILIESFNKKQVLLDEAITSTLLMIGEKSQVTFSFQHILGSLNFGQQKKNSVGFWSKIKYLCTTPVPTLICKACGQDSNFLKIY